MLNKVKRSLKKCSLAVLFVLFLLAPISVYANNIRFPAEPWELGSPPPGNFYEPPTNQPFSPPDVFNLTPLPSNWSSYMLGERALTRRQEGMDIRGLVPVIDESFNATDAINMHILDNIIMSLIGEARRLRARAISFSFDYHPADDIISIVIYANVATTLPHTLVRSVNFCILSGKILTMNEAMGMDIVSLAERILAEKIRSNPEHYYAALFAPFAGQAFFLTGSQLVILFDGFRLSTMVETVDTIELFRHTIKEVVLSAQDYRTDGPYGLKMIPLRAMLEAQLGYTVQWDDRNRHVVISRNGVEFIQLRPGDNDYIVLGAQRLSLEAAPQIYGDYMYVPITFFDQILPLTTFSIGVDGSITFLAYLPYF